MATGQRDYLGIGWKFPIQVAPNQQIAMSSYEQRVEESIYLILGTAAGERLMMPSFGCGIQDLVFAPNNANTISLVTRSVRNALTAYEARIDLLDVEVDSAPDQPNLLLIRISYRIRANNAVGNLVYPFYVSEG